MKRKTTYRCLPVCVTLVLGLTLPLLLQGQWLPFSAQYKEQTLRTLPDGSEELLEESKGVLFRASSGSEMRTRVREFFDFRQGEPSTSVFAIPEDYTITDRSPVLSNER